MISTKWYTDKQIGFYAIGAKAIDHYNKNIIERREQISYTPKEDYSGVIETLNDKGYCRVENFFNHQTLDKLQSEFDTLLKLNKHTKLVQGGNHTQIVQPYLNTNTAFEIATDSRIVDIATTFYSCLPALGTCNLRQSKPNNSPAMGTCMFHRDFNSPAKFLKFFVYLDDVGLNNGPFTYVETSNRRMPRDPHWESQHRWSDNQIEEVYGKGSIKHLTANKGDLLIGLTTGFHKGQKIQEGSRTMLTINWVIHPEIEDKMLHREASRFHVQKEKVNELEDWKRPVADFLIKV